MGQRGTVVGVDLPTLARPFSCPVCKRPSAFKHGDFFPSDMSVPGIFAAMDVGQASTRGIASLVGEGSAPVATV